MKDVNEIKSYVESAPKELVIRFFHEVIKCKDLFTNLEICAYLGKKAFEINKVSIAEVFFQQCLIIKKTNSSGYIGLSNVYKSQGNSRRAIEIIKSGYNQVVNSKDKAALAMSFVRSNSEDIDISSLCNYIPKIQFSKKPELVNAALVMMVKDEEDIIFNNLFHHYNLGFRNFVIINNNSNDKTYDEITRFKRLDQTIKLALIDDEIIGYYQDTKTTAASRFANLYFKTPEQSIDWIFPLDADEFLSIPNEKNLSDILKELESKNKKVLMYYLRDAASQSLVNSISSLDNPFDIFNVVSPFLFKSIPKVAFRFNEYAILHMGNHFVDNCLTMIEELETAAFHGIYLTHFNLRGVGHAKRKFVNGGIAYKALNSRGGSGSRWKKHFENYQVNGETYFKKLYLEYIEEIIASVDSNLKIDRI